MAKKHLQSLTLDADALIVRGPDALNFLQGMLTADVRRGARLSEGAAYAGGTFLLDQKAKIVAPSKYWVFRAQELILSAPKGTGAKVAEELERFHVADDFEITQPAKLPWAAQLLVHAPDTFSITDIPGPGEGAHDRVYQLLKTSWGYVLPLPEWGADFFQLWVEDLTRLQTEFEVAPIAKSDIEDLRMQRGVPQWGVDFDRESLVLEFPHATEISFFKGCYKGQEIVARATYRGKLQKSFVRFQAETGQVLSPGFVFNSDEPEKPVGKITSARGEYGLGLARISSLSTGRLFQGEAPNKRTFIQKAVLLIEDKA